MEEITEFQMSIAKKPCLILGYCPYGPLVEDFPIPTISRQEAVDHNDYLKKALRDGVFDGHAGMTRAEAEKEIAEFDENDYLIQSGQTVWTCGVFGHQCPVKSVAEPFVDGE